MSDRKRKKCPFTRSLKRPRRRNSKRFTKERAAILAESDKGSYFDQNALQEEAGDEAAKVKSASAAKLTRSVEEGEPRSLPQTEETWQRVEGRAIVDAEILQQALTESLCCRHCRSIVELTENTSVNHGLGHTWLFKCKNEKCSAQRPNVEFTTTPKTSKIFDVNRSLVLGMRTIGRGQAAVEKLFSFLDMTPLSKNAWTDTAKKIEAEAQLVLEEELSLAVQEMRDYRFALGEIECTREELKEKVLDVGITIDASWCSRGWSATDAVVAVISVDTGKVLDVVHLSSLCAQCKRMDERRTTGEISRLQYLDWYVKHEPECRVNHDGSSASMEAAGAKILYARSGDLHRIRYIPFIGDGDSKAYSAVVQAAPYGLSVHIPKEECVSHVTKRMGTGLRTLVKDYKGKKLADGKGIGGAGRLTLARIDTIQNFFGRAIRDNKNDAAAMSRATHAILKHYSSTVEDPKHDDCPEDPSSWCSYQRDRVNGTNLHQPIKNPLPEAVVEVCQPLCDRLGNESFLTGCEKCYTQNSNESLHHVIWGLAPKDAYSSSIEISAAISLGVLQFNRGFLATYSRLVPNLGMDVTDQMSSMWEQIDGKRLYQAEYRSSEEVKRKRKKKRKNKLKKQDAFTHQEGVMYKSGSFHGDKAAPKRTRKCFRKK